MNTDTLYYIESIIESIQEDTNDLLEIVKGDPKEKTQFINNIISKLEELKSVID